jgi:hypothetical protein
MYIEAESHDDNEEDNEDSGGSEEKVLTIISLRESCLITEEAMEYSGDSEPL